VISIGLQKVSRNFSPYPSCLQDEDNMQEALRHSAALLGELRTSLLGPQKYYELYMQANDELRSLEVWIRSIDTC